MPLTEALCLQVHRCMPRWILSCYPGPNQALQPVTVSVEVLQRFKRHPQILDQPQGEIEFFRADSRCLGAVLALTPDLGVIEECLRDILQPQALRITTDSRLCNVICATAASPVRANA